MAEKLEELMTTYSRAELDRMAKELGLKPEDYPNKEAVAKAIIAARKGKPPVVKVKIPEKIGKVGVFAKMKATEKFIGEVGTSVRRLQADISNQVKENDSAVRRIGTGVKELQKGMAEKADVVEDAVKKIQADVSRQAKENEAAVKKINIGVSEIQDSMAEKAKEVERGAREIQAGTKAQAKENEAYKKDFYYG